MVLCPRYLVFWFGVWLLPSIPASSSFNASGAVKRQKTGRAGLGMFLNFEIGGWANILGLGFRDEGIEDMGKRHILRYAIRQRLAWLNFRYAPRDVSSIRAQECRLCLSQGMW
ncbi:hypothetical protein WG66_011583 [Moniliophthora roreri]|nr:hypothetical protein WG66_011583 [Moniliophthora roreri]